MKNLRWYIAGMLMLATMISYLDRQALSIAAPVLREQFKMSNRDYAYIVSAFLLAYAITQPIAGRLIDWLNTRRGFAISITFWSLASIAHSLAGGVGSFAVCRFLLGVGEAGSFPGAIKTVAEWFPDKEKTLATGVFNMGAGAGAVIAPPLITWIILRFGWREAFVATGAVGFLWLIGWLWLYHQPEKHPKLTKEELYYIRAGQSEQQDEGSTGGVLMRDVLLKRELWGLMLAKMLADPAWYFYIFWLPNYLKDVRHFSLLQIGYFAWVPFLTADVGSMLGGALAAYFMKRGMPVITSRKVAMCVCSAMMPVAVLAVRAESPAMAIFYISIATMGHQMWSASALTLPADLFPKKIVASAFGFTGASGVFGGMLFAQVIGILLDRVGYVPVFTIAGCMHPIATVILLVMIRSFRQNSMATSRKAAK